MSLITLRPTKCEENTIEKGLRGLYYAPDHLKTQGMCEKAETFNPYMLRFVTDHFKIQEKSDAAVMKDPCVLEFVPDHFKTKKMCQMAVEDEPEALELVPDHFQMQKICDKAVKDESSSLLFVPDWFVSQQQIKSWHDDDDFYGDNEIIDWYNGYQKCKAQKSKIKEELMSIAWHSSRWWDWCVPEDEKNRQINCF